MSLFSDLYVVIVNVWSILAHGSVFFCRHCHVAFQIALCPPPPLFLSLAHSWLFVAGHDIGRTQNTNISNHNTSSQKLKATFRKEKVDLKMCLDCLRGLCELDIEFGHSKKKK